MKIFLALYSLLIILLGILLPVFQKYYLRESFKYPLFAIIFLGFLGAFIYLYSCIRKKGKKYLRISGVIFSFLLGILINLYISKSTPIFLAALRERIHLFEYGLLAVIFYHSFKNEISEKLIYIGACFYGGIIGIIDEFFQYFIAGRVGDLRDVMINILSVFVGAFFAFSLNYESQKIDIKSSKKIYILSFMFFLMLGTFIYTVHRGYLIKDPEIGEFKSKYYEAKLLEISEQKEKIWKKEKLKNPARFSKPKNYYSGKIIVLEDIYFKEALLRTGKRNKYFREKKYLKAYKENEILEKYYRPFIIYFSEQWTDIQKAICLKKIGRKKDIYYKSKSLSFIYTGMKIKVLIYGIVIILFLHLLISYPLFSRKPNSHFPNSPM
ncbi:VanZ family protein [SCandidatus Aminicenantes bacterium Aminicenantia_JdfR_composite]|jgi:VanZ family protein|nr:VanZ family protein [SCandidatus Aminicenantes bacterium Aminicenantia_JdfR_composite]MCP2597227.1 VanZ family protein [Candidatus Aminicenantes bacterium AC-335-G13]MCP2597725.1 VanZ family protein [Candidatus Aminicenantes bacterium AC-335-L06]MCP2620892.1 VanZ family protein [Candidatus Aminicenantes bacterium AC-334-E05]